ncbi:MAG TPA: MFS transporter [Solirubrobacteraceae bacterium]|nr:MFS transporter [Solirubrobacteraceae bacterium]
MNRVLQIPAFRRLLAAYTLNELAFMVGSLTLALLVYQSTGSAFGAAAFFLASQFVPALLAPLAVARLEHRRPRPVLPALYWFEAIVFFALAWVAGHFSLIAVLVLALVDGVAALTARSLARAATVTVTAEAGLLREGNAIANGAFSVCFMVGPALGGAVVAAGGTSAALIADGCLFGVIGFTLATASGLPEPSPSRHSARGRVRAAIAYAREHVVIRRLLLLQVFGVLFFTISVPVEVVFAEHSLHAGSEGYGALLSAWGAGAVAGAAIYARWRALPSRDLIVIGAGSLGIGFLVMAIAPTLAVAIVGAAFAGIGNGVEAVAARTALQEATQERWMALMMSLNESLFQSVPGAGILLGGALAAVNSPRSALAVAGAGSLAVTVAAWFALMGLNMTAQPSEGPGGDAPSALDDGIGHDPDLGPNGRDPEPFVGSEPDGEPARAPVWRHQ